MTSLHRSFGLLVILSVLGGCESSKPQTPNSLAAIGQNANVNVPPHQLMQDVERIVASPPLSLPIEKEEKGSILTGWKEYPGNWHIIRRWQERTRYRIMVSPDFDQPTQRSHIQVTEETQQRAASQQEFQSSTELQRPDRAQAVLQQILQQLGTK